ncbi:MAG: hypothetical protein IKS19_07955 [Clostridia bacterium]|nr:hypothetical protein [Clostridia bacterium]
MARPIGFVAAGLPDPIDGGTARGYELHPQQAYPYVDNFHLFINLSV